MPAVQEDEGLSRTPLDAEWHARCFTGGFLTVPMKLGLTEVTQPAQVHTVSGNLHHDLNVRLLGPAVFCPFCPSSMDTFGRVCFFFFPVPNFTREVKGWLEISWQAVRGGDRSQSGLLWLFKCSTASEYVGKEW